MSSSNKFGFGPLGADPVKRRDRKPGPMGTAVRETAESLAESTEAKIEQRRQNAEDAKSWREAQSEGRVLVQLPLSEIRDTALPRDRLALDAVAQSEEMDELKASILSRGQREPVEVWRDGSEFQLKKGWRRWTALKQLYQETGEARFGFVTARVEDEPSESQLGRYVDMVEENVVREDLTFAEMAQVAISAAHDPSVEEADADALVGRLYGSLHKTKRSYIRAFVYLLSELGDELRWPKAVGRNLGVDVSRALKGSGDAAALRAELRLATDPDAQGRVFAAFLTQTKALEAGRAAPRKKNAKLEFHVGATKVTARGKECRIVSDASFSEIPRETLERAIAAFEQELSSR